MSISDAQGWIVFAKVAELGSFSEAATELGIGKATVSKTIGRLETNLGLMLIHRTSRAVSLTTSGVDLATDAKQLADFAEALDDRAREGSATPSGIVRMAVPMSFGLRCLGEFAAHFAADYPEIELDIHLSDSKADLIADGFDVGLRIADLPDSSMIARKIRDVALHIVASPEYLQEHGEPEHPSDLYRHACLRYSLLPRPTAWRFKHVTLGEYFVEPRGPILANNSDVLRESVRSGVGIAIMPDFIVGDDLKDGTVTPILTNWKPPDVALHLITPPGRLRPLRVQIVIDRLRNDLSTRQ
ncbi:LysR family transcriptional regulator [Croceicoccus sp. F390]|uniref:LysR family transcriptional regulator n=1 Tax=Croceicoccus esteveae TaxID=3075597 RepID=A0ABU2ZK21_9SPHN|nr:LysR family transcriptional regulator [Croceicoccus sp. F390]MDT0576953.1 LysR family transcriptional regulator [Croceicoccus sp. F390]